jgi:transcriptional regulator with XRE-family HTH domain
VEVVVTGGGQQGAPGFSPGRLRAARRAAGLTQAQVSTALGVHKTVIAHWERGERVPRVDRLGALARVLRVQPVDLTDPPVSSPVTLRTLRIGAGLLQEGLAAGSGLTRTKYASLERGEVASLSQRDSVALAAVLGVSAAEVQAAHGLSRSAFLSR